MKNSDKVLLLIGIVVIIGGLFIYSTKGEADTVLDCTLPNDTAGVNEVTYKEYECLIKDSGKDIVYIGAAHCSFCTRFSPIIDEVAKEYNVPVYYLDIDNLSETEYSKLLNSISYFEEQNGKWGTPTTFVLKGNKVLDVLGGYNEKETIITWLTKNNIITGE